MYEIRMNRGYYESPLGWVKVVGSEDAILSVEFVDEPGGEMATSSPVDLALEQLSEYFQGIRRTFDIPLTLEGTDFQRNVWQELMKIPYGQCTTYQAIADRIGKPKAVRAVGAANGRNPISILVPCHRVIGSDGKLTGYGGGIWRKKWLLVHEGCMSF
jgi:methylated-DNA-[protein]-cysteine S-methyltransferase